MKQYIQRYFTAFICFSCLNVMGQESIEIRIDPITAGETAASDVLEEVRYIPLETTRESLFGSITSLYVGREHFIIYDEYSNSILMFGRDGKFRWRVRREKFVTGGITVNEAAKEIISNRGRYMIVHDFNGKKLRETGWPVTGTLRWLKGGYLAVADYRVFEGLEDRESPELKLLKDGKIVGAWLPYHMRKAPVKTNDFLRYQHSQFFETGNDTSVLYARFYDYNIYQLGISGMKAAYRFIFPMSRSMPAGFATDAKFSMRRRIDYVQEHPDMIYAVSFVYRYGNAMLFRLEYAHPDHMSSYLYNLESGTTVKWSDITPDGLTGGLPVTDMGLGDIFINRNFLTSDGAYAYTAISSGAMFKWREEHGRNFKLNGKMTASLFRNRKPESNPVIVMIKPKSRF